MTKSSGEQGIAWQEWGDEAFRESQRLDRPILLDIGAVWCHWCHVMDDGIPGDPLHTGTYRNSDVVRLIADNFVPIKVDNDRRPDINARYNMGGWPSTVFLNPKGEILYGETYVHPERMISLLEYITDFYGNKKEQLAEQTNEVRSRRADEGPVRLPIRPIDRDAAVEVAAALNRNFDPVYGGFGKEPKFPHPAALLFAIERSVTGGDGQMRIVAERTLEGMAGGGMYDQYAGGFFRYSTTRDWSVPHYEKMLEDNAKLLTVCAAAAAACDDDKYIDVATSVRGWLTDVMLDGQTGAFAGSQDADEEERYYGEPLDVRASMPTPYIDRTVYCSWNALAVSAYARLYQVQRLPILLAAAEKTFHFLKHNLSTLEGDPEDWSAVRTTRRYFTGGSAAGTTRLLTDQTDLAGAALNLYETTGDSTYLLDAAHTANAIVQSLVDKSGALIDVLPESNAIGELARPNIEIQENAEAALVLLRLAGVTGNATYRSVAEGALNYFAESYRRSGYFAASYARAVEACLGPAPHIAIVGSRENVKELQSAAWKLVVPGKTVETIFSDNVGSSDKASRPQTVTSTLPIEDAARAYVCIGDRCLAPVSDPSELRSLVLGLYKE